MNMLDKKFKHNRLREKPDQKNKKKDKKVLFDDKRLRDKPSSKNTSKEYKEPKYLSYLHEVLQPPCIVCQTHMGIEMHHIKEASSDPKDDRFVIPLCHEHHLGNKFSAHGSAKQFRAKYSYQTQMAAAQKLYEGYKI